MSALKRPYMQDLGASTTGAYSSSEMSIEGNCREIHFIVSNMANGDGDAVLQIFLGPPGGLLPFIDPGAGPAYGIGGFDLSFLPASPSLSPISLLPGVHVFPPGTIVLFEVSYLSGALPAVGTDGLTVSLIGSV